MCGGGRVNLADRLSKAKDLLIDDEPFANLPDVIGYQDIVHQWDRGYRATLERLIRSGDTGPRGAQIHDFPKNETAVRPLAHFDPRDRIIYEAMVYRIAPRIDRQLHPYVYSYKCEVSLESHHREVVTEPGSVAEEGALTCR
jgi:hypothetical protein